MPRSGWRAPAHLVRGAVLGLLCGAVSLAASGSARAQGAPVQDFTTRAKQAVLMEAETGAILYQSNADALVPPASMSKLMTLAVVFKNLKNGPLKLEDEFAASENAWRKGGAPSGTAAMFVPINVKATVAELIQGVTVQSGNDAAMVLAEGVAGSETAFTQLMQEEAKRIGLKKSQFRNSSGLYHPDHLMTARDLAILARYLIREYPDRYPYFSQKEFFYRKHKFYNRNPLLNIVPGIDGMKTGYVKESGYGMVASAVQEGRRLIAVVGGLETENDRRDEARKLLEWGFRGFAEFKIFGEGEIVGTARVWGGDHMFVPLSGKGELKVLLPRSAVNQRLRAELGYMSPLKAPLVNGDAVATQSVTSASGAMNEVPLRAAEDVGKGGMMRRGLDSLTHMALGWVLF